MKEKLLKIGTILLALIMLFACIPTTVTRIKNEEANNNVVLSLLYRDLQNRLSSSEIDEALDDYREIGVNTISIMEEDLNNMIYNGTVTSITFGVMRHKYDDESVAMANLLEENPNVRTNSHCILTKREEEKAFLEKWIPKKFAEDEYCKVTDEYGTDIYCIYDGSLQTYEVVLGYDESQLQMAKDRGLDICLIFKIKNYGTDAYLEELERLIQEYPVKYLNIKDDGHHPEKNDEGKEHYEGISNLIQKYDLTLIVTENADQLGNQEPFGYDEIFRENSTHVMRSYETSDCFNMDETGYMFRYYQYLNSTVDRNIRFITITQIIEAGEAPVDLHERTVKATKMYADEIERLGYQLDGQKTTFDYPDLGRLVYSAAAVLMILMALVMIEILAGKFMPKLTVLAFILSALAVVGTKFLMPQSFVHLYSTAWAVLMPSFAITVTFWYYKKAKKILPMIPLILSVFLVMVGIMAVGGLVQSAQLSGLSYYVNNIYFRGIKASLFLPLLYGAVAFYFLYMKESRNICADIKTIVRAEIRVYWVLLAAAIGGVGFYYILRSGNVNSIGFLEQAMRTKITDFFIARPRTKEFLIGYPSLMLFVFYMKKNIKPVAWLFGIGASILAASVSNTFCHVFTDCSTIYMRVVNGFFIGIIVCAAVYIVNLLVYRGICRLVEYINQKSA